MWVSGQKGDKEMKREVYTAYAETADMTFIIEEVATENGTSIEVIGFYFGEPSEECTRTYKGKIKGIIGEEEVHEEYEDGITFDGTVYKLI